MNWILFTLFLNAQTGDIDHYETQPMTAEDCIAALHYISRTDHNIVSVRKCRQVDKDGKPIEEVKVDPNGNPLDEDGNIKPEAPKSST